MNSGVVEYGSNCVTFSLTILISRRSHIQRFHTNFLPTLHCNSYRPNRSMITSIMMDETDGKEL